MNKILEKQIKEPKKIHTDKRNIIIMNIDELRIFYKKTNKPWVCITLDRNTSEVLDFEIGYCGRLIYINLALKLQAKLNIENLCNKYEVYLFYRNCQKTSRN